MKMLFPNYEEVSIALNILDPNVGNPRYSLVVGPLKSYVALVAFGGAEDQAPS